LIINFHLRLKSPASIKLPLQMLCNLYVIYDQEAISSNFVKMGLESLCKVSIRIKLIVPVWYLSIMEFYIFETWHSYRRPSQICSRWRGADNVMSIEGVIQIMCRLGSSRSKKTQL